MATNKGKDIKKAQAVSNVPGYDKYWRLNNLPPEVFERTYEMLKRHSPRVIAELLQSEGHNCDIQPITLAHLLASFRSERIPEHQLISPYLVARLSGELRRSVNVFSELAELVEVQRQRIRQALSLEETEGELLPETTKLIHSQARLLKTMGDLGLRAGLLNQFSQDYLAESQRLEDEMTLETRRMFLRYFSYIAQNGNLDNVLDNITSLPEDPLAE